MKREIRRGSCIGAHVVLNLLNEVRKRDKCEACRAFYLFIATSLMNPVIHSTNARFYLLHDIKIS